MTAAPTIPPDASVAAIRFSSLGDVVLAGAALAAAHRERPDLDFHLFTKAAYGELFAGLDWLTVHPLAAPAGLAELGGQLRQLRALDPAVVVDLHGTLRARLLRVATPELAWRRAAKRSARRWLWARLGRPDRDAPHVVQRFAAPFGVDPEPGPWLPTGAERQPDLLALVPGAAWATKRWPADRFAAVADRWRRQGGRVRWLGGEGERETIAAHADAADEQVLQAPLTQVAAALAEAACTVANDTGLGHLSAAVGTPVAAVFGPTVEGFGFTPWGAHRAVSLALDCRPCTLHGDERCPLGHHRCMQDLPADRVAAAVAGLVPAPAAAAKGGT